MNTLPKLCRVHNCRTRTKPGHSKCADHEHEAKQRKARLRRKRQRELAVVLDPPPFPPVQLADPRHHALCSRIAYELGSTLQAVVYGGRSKSIVRARRACYYALRKLELSWHEVGDVLGFDHTSAMFGVGVVEHEIAADPQGTVATVLKRVLTGAVSDKADRLRKTIAALQVELGELECDMAGAAE